MSQLWAPSKTAPFMQSIPLLEYENGREFYVLLEDNESQLVDELPDTHRVRKVRVGEGLHGWMRLCVSSTLIDDEDDTAAAAAPTPPRCRDVARLLLPRVSVLRRWRA